LRVSENIEVGLQINFIVIVCNKSVRDR